MFFDTVWIGPVLRTGRFLMLTGLVLLLTGCAFFNPQTPQGSTPVTTKLSAFYQALGQIPFGTVQSVNNPATARQEVAQILDQYTSAAGVPCRHIQLQQGLQARRLTLCKSDAGLWFQAPKIKTQVQRIR